MKNISFDPKKDVPEKIPVPIIDYDGTDRFIQKTVGDRGIIVKGYALNSYKIIRRYCVCWPSTPELYQAIEPTLSVSC